MARVCRRRSKEVYTSDAGVRVKVYKPENMDGVTRVGML